MADMELTGAEIVVRCLRDEGIKHIFGYPGGAVLNIYDEIYKQTDFEHILVRHEQAAVMPRMAMRVPPGRSAWRSSPPGRVPPMR